MIYKTTTIIAGLAWDWVNQKLYWTDNCDDDIEVYDPSTQVRRVLFDVNIFELHAIVVDPTTGYVYACIISTPLLLFLLL